MNRLLIRSLALVISSFLPNMLHAAPAEDAEALVEALKKTANLGDGITAEETTIAKKIQKLGAPAIPFLLPLLRDKNQDIRDLASYTLRDTEGLTEEHLDALIESRRRGDGWIPPAIARIGTPRAVKFLVEELVGERQTYTQLTGAIRMLGEKAVPDLVKVFQSDIKWDWKLEETMTFVFKELGQQAVGAIEPLLKMASDQTASTAMRVRAIDALGAMDSVALKAAPELRKLEKDRDPKIRSAANSAIIKVDKAEGAIRLAKTLERANDASGRASLLRDVAKCGPAGKGAGPLIGKYLKDVDWGVRLEAARAVGDIGYEKAADDLIGLLDDAEDWQLVYSAAESLGCLKAERAESVLLRVSTDHWYLPVRDAANAAIKVIHGDAPQETGVRWKNFYYAGSNLDFLKEKEAALLRWPVVMATDEPVTVAIKEKVCKFPIEALRGVKVDGGWLAGVDQGEWGGAILFVNSKGRARVIEKENTQSLYQTEQGILAVTGLGHMSSRGMVYRVSKNDESRWVATKWRRLPGYPEFSRLLQDGKLFVSCYGGMVLISPNGDMKLLTFKEALKDGAASR